MRLLTSALLAASMIVATPAAAQEAPAAPPPATAPAPWGYVPYPYAAPPPSWWRSAPAPVVTERRSNAMRIAGITLFVVGGATTTVGAGFFAFGFGTSCTIINFAGDAPPRAHRGGARERVGSTRQALGGCGADTVRLGASIMAAGVLGSAGGIPLFVLGNARVRAAAPELRLGLGGADLGWTF